MQKIGETVIRIQSKVLSVMHFEDSHRQDFDVAMVKILLHDCDVFPSIVSVKSWAGIYVVFLFASNNNSRVERGLQEKKWSPSVQKGGTSGGKSGGSQGMSTQLASRSGEQLQSEVLGSEGEERDSEEAAIGIPGVPLLRLVLGLVTHWAARLPRQPARNGDCR